MIGWPENCLIKLSRYGEGRTVVQHRLPQIGAGATDRKPKTAIVLNGNARSVTHRSIQEIGRLLTTESLYVSRSLEQSRFIARQIVNGGYDVVLCGGGDGTFMRVVSDIMALHPARPPAFGSLRLGTGNAIASALGAAGANRHSIARELRHAAGCTKRLALPLVRVEGEFTPFAGCGADAMILQDYRRAQRLMPGETIKSIFAGPLGYGYSIATRSLWRYLSRALPEVIIRNEGLPATRVDLDGNPVGRPIPQGGVIYRGRVSMAAAATIPFVGFGVKLYPQAGKRADRFQLRVGQAGVTELLTRLPKVLSGKFESDRIFDFYCTAVSIHAPKGTAFQAGGDPIGIRKRVLLQLDQVEGLPGIDRHSVPT